MSLIFIILTGIRIFIHHKGSECINDRETVRDRDILTTAEYSKSYHIHWSAKITISQYVMDRLLWMSDVWSLLLER